MNKESELGFQLLSELIKKGELLNISEKDNRELLKNLLNRKDISHRELFGNINSLISKEILEELSILDNFSNIFLEIRIFIFPNSSR